MLSVNIPIIDGQEMAASLLVNKGKLARILKTSLPTLNSLLERYPDFPIGEQGSNGVEWRFDARKVRDYLREEEEAANDPEGRASGCSSISGSSPAILKTSLPTVKDLIDRYTDFRLSTLLHDARLHGRAISRSAPGKPRPFSRNRGHGSEPRGRMTANLPVWRSMLFVPVTAERFVNGAAGRGADAIILDLEDAVAASEKERARRLVPEAARKVAAGGADVVVRLNRPLRMTVRDLEAAIGSGVQAVMLPKTNSAQHVQLVAEIIDELEAERGMTIGATKMMAMVETCDAFFRIHEIAKASLRLVALYLAAEDFAPGVFPEPEGLFMPKQMCVFAARAAGIMPLGFVGTVAEYRDLEGFREMVRRARRLGFVGACVIHPSQIPILNEEFRPATAEVEHAGRVVAAYDKALAEGVGAVTVDGKMIDVPIVERAKLLLVHEAAIAGREAKKQAAAG